MLKSMTGFGSKEARILPCGTASVELKSINYKFLEVVTHLPEGFSSLEERIKKEIESRIKRGRINCMVNVSGVMPAEVFVNKKLLKNYIHAAKEIRSDFGVKGEVSLDTLLTLPGVLALAQNKNTSEEAWSGIKIILQQALDSLVKTRQKEGLALAKYLKSQISVLDKELIMIKARFKKAIKDKTSGLKTDEECSSFLKASDITEELDRLSFHVKNFKSKLSRRDPVGKELDFIAQEMQREANTIGAKSCDADISGRIVQIKTQIDKMREQVQNIE